jgi:DNA (cytosine-5)-methyltransferase 1
LIDIYGHYANRGDTVKIDATWRLLRNSKLLKSINKFSKSLDCGAFIGREELLDDLGVLDGELDTIIMKMRRIRLRPNSPSLESRTSERRATQNGNAISAV